MENNTLTEFKNVLPKKIFLDPAKNWYAALEHIGLDLNFENLPITQDLVLMYGFDFNHYMLKLADFSLATDGYPGNTVHDNKLSKFQNQLFLGMHRDIGF